jgi:hypothetical protein
MLVIKGGTGMVFFNTGSTAQGGGGSFKDRAPIGEVGCFANGKANTLMDGKVAGVPGYLSIYLSIYLSTFLSIYLPIYLSIYHYRSIYLPVYLSAFLSVYLSIYLPTYLSMCLSV